jgi:hypothetical protein
MFAGTGNDKGREEAYSVSRTGHTHIVILYQDGQGSYYCLQWKEHIGGFLGDFDGHPDCIVCCLPASVPSSNGGAIAGRVIGHRECGADGESDGGRRGSKRPESFRDVRSCTNSAGGVGVETEISVGGFDLRKRRITKVDGQINLIHRFDLEDDWQRGPAPDIVMSGARNRLLPSQRHGWHIRGIDMARLVPRFAGVGGRCPGGLGAAPSAPHHHVLYPRLARSLFGPHLRLRRQVRQRQR